MYGKIKEYLQHELAEIEAAGLYKRERIIASPQRAEIEVAGRKVLNFCANNYLGLSDNPRLIEAAKRAMDNRGYGMSSVRFICGCQDIHKELEKVIADYFGTEDTILYAACFDANGGVFEPLFTEEDAIISDSLNHASIIDGVRLCKAVRYRYANADMGELEECLKKAQAQRFRIVVTDGVFSMDGNAAPLDKICALAEKYDALVMVDECHSAGVLAKRAAASPNSTICAGRWISSRVRSARPSEAPWADSPPAAGRSSTCCASVRVPTSSPTRCPLPWSVPGSRPLRCSRRATNCTTGWWPTSNISVPE